MYVCVGGVACLCVITLRFDFSLSSLSLSLTYAPSLDATLVRISIAFSAGLGAAVSPCVIVLVPLVLFRFVKQQKERAGTSRVKEMTLFVMGFQLSFLVFGYLLSVRLSLSLSLSFSLAVYACVLFMSVHCAVANHIHHLLSYTCIYVV
jgi:cytochrome c biogenesis protein CcdA